ncbi:hypothetical protein [Humisphaera borealis]|uniref:Uncharacterized protein n=1 Tax=Humisphaera borealis TaxID=2807512 RepID=A0A7M2WQG5_9BACT|nr:hypothetical protein [Humisphaera borealis]QOV87767.1 hypothetical protein IPV69_15915 [Humisphaera borealis]
MTALQYDTPLGVGQVRVHAPSSRELYIEVGPPPAAQQVIALAPLGLLFLLLGTALGLFTYSAIFRPAAIPYSKLLLIPTIVAMGFAAMELAAALRRWSVPSKLSVIGGTFQFAYPSPRSAPEEVDAMLIRRISVVTARSRVLRRSVSALEIGLAAASGRRTGPRFLLFRGYPKRTLDELSDLLGPALGMNAVAQ